MGRDGLLLLRTGPVVKDKANGPIPLTHHCRCMPDDSEIEAIQSQIPVPTLVDMKYHNEVAIVLGWLGGEIGGQTGAKEVTTTGFEVVAVELPERRCHASPPCCGTEPPGVISH